MTPPILLCTDGSEQSLDALSVGIELLGRTTGLVLVTVATAPDPESLVGSGHAGPDMNPQQYDREVTQATEGADAVIRLAQSQLGLAGLETRVVWGDPGAAICDLAKELSAQAIVLGSRGRGGLKRAILGSVSDHVVRNAPCSVIVTRSQVPR